MRKTKLREVEFLLDRRLPLWRLRPATAMEAGFFDIEADHLGAGTIPRLRPPSRDVIYALFRSDVGGNAAGTAALPAKSPAAILEDGESAADPRHHLAQCFLRLANLPSFPLDRLSRYEYALWRQVAQILFALEALNRRKPQER